MKIISFNGRIWTRDKDKNSPYYWRDRMEAMQIMLKDEAPDIIFLQEMPLPANKYVRKLGTYKMIGWLSRHPIFVRKDIKVLVSRHKKNFEFARIVNYGITYNLINIHSSWETVKLRKDLQEIVDLLGIPKNNTIIGGDFNVDLKTLNSVKFFTDCGYKSVRKLLGYSEILDTYISIENNNHGAIDHFFVNKDFVKDYNMIVDNYWVKRLSDHFPIEITI